MKICDMDPFFRMKFLPKLEQPIPEARYRYARLKRHVTDDSLVAEIGGTSKADIALAGVWFLLKAQRNAEPGPLDADGHVNVLHVYGPDGALYIVYSRWYNAGWAVGARPIDVGRTRRSGGRVFSLDPTPKPIAA